MPTKVTDTRSPMKKLARLLLSFLRTLMRFNLGSRRLHGKRNLQRRVHPAREPRRRTCPNRREGPTPAARLNNQKSRNCGTDVKTETIRLPRSSSPIDANVHSQLG